MVDKKCPRGVLSLVCYVLIVSILIISLGLVIAAPFFAGVGVINNTDIFYSPAEYINFTISTVGNILDNATLVRVNLSSINATACDGDGFLNLTNTTALDVASVIWNGGCAVSSFFNNTITTPTLILGGNFSFISYNSTGGTNTTVALAPILLHNLGVPSMQDPTNCTRFGSKTTNMSGVSNFSSVNFIIHIQVNFTCQTLGIYNGTNPGGFEDVALINLTSVNMTQSDIGTKLAALRDAINATIGSPKTFEPSRIYVNSSAFDALNTTGNITLYNLPFTSKPNVLADEGALVSGSNITWYPGGYSSAKEVNIGNLTFTVGHFSGYNATDTINPLVNITSPASGVNISSGNVMVQVLINTTGTEPSYISISGLNATTYFYNGTSSENTAGCLNTSVDREAWNCTVVFSVASLSQGLNTVRVNASDYGNVSGNLNSSTRTFNVDTIGPVVAVSSVPDSYVKVNSTLFNISSIDATNSAIACWMTIDGGLTNYTMTKVGNYFNYTNSSLADGNYLAKYYCNDSFGNINNTVTTNFTIDTVSPILTVVNSSSITTSSATIGYASSESVNVSINYGSFVSLGTLNNLNSYSLASEISLGSLSASTTYYYNLTICDRAGNCATNGTLEFTTLAEAIAEVTSSRAANIIYYPALTSTQFVNGYAITMLKKGSVSFKIGNATHRVGIIDLNAGSKTATINVSSTPQIKTLFIGEEWKVNVDGDNYYDVLVKLNSVLNNRVNITIIKINEAISTSVIKNETTSADEPVVSEEVGETPEMAESLFSLRNITLVIILFVVFIIIFFIVRYNRQTKLMHSIRYTNRYYP